MTDPRGTTSPDAQAIILICTSLGAGLETSDIKPLGPRTWAKLSAALEDARLPGPASLLGLSAEEMSRLLSLGETEASRLARLLARHGQLAFELDRLTSRGLWVTTLADAAYPSRLRDRLRIDAPPVLFGAGEASLLGHGGVAIVGSRDADLRAIEFTERLARGLAMGGTQVVSGGARGVDAWAMRASFAADGTVVGVLPEGLERRLREPENREAIVEGRAVLVSPYRPDASFSAGAAMARNKLIYTLSEIAVVVSSSEGSGGTWAGALEAIEEGWIPVLVRVGGEVPHGNDALVGRGASPLPETTAFDVVDVDQLRSLARTAVPQVQEPSPGHKQVTLFDD